VARYKEYADLPEHIRGMLRAVTNGTDDTAERYAHVPHKHLKGLSIMALVNAPFGQRAVERFLLDTGNYLGVDDIDDFQESFGKRR